MNGPKFNDKMDQAKKLFVETAFADEQDWICMPIYGTTTSGDPAGTTLVNTFHSLMFDWLYVIEAFGIQNPWRRDTAENYGITNFAAGDDTFIMCKESMVSEINNIIRFRTSSSKANDIEIGFGQVIDH